MSRVTLIEQLYAEKKKSALEFDYDALWAPPIMSIFTQQDIAELYRIATSLRYNANIEKKYELIDSIMKARGFKKSHCGTNRVVYNFLENPTFVAKVAIDRVGLRDSPIEYKNQQFFKPFCCKIFEVDSSGVIAFVERVNPITSLEEFLSVSDDIFNMMITKIIGKYVVDDLGTEKFMNYGLRYNANGTTFGPVIIDFPYAYELDGRKLICNRPIETPLGVFPCGGEIDYDDGLNHLVCTKCKKQYEAMDLQKDNSNMLVMYGDNEGGYYLMRTKIVRANGEVLLDTGMSSNNHITKEQYDNLPSFSDEEKKVTRVTRNKRVHYEKPKEYKKNYYSSLQAEQYNKMNQMNSFNPVISENVTPATAIKCDNEYATEKEGTDTQSGYYIVRVKSATEQIDDSSTESVDCCTEKLNGSAHEEIVNELDHSIDTDSARVPQIYRLKSVYNSENSSIDDTSESDNNEENTDSEPASTEGNIFDRSNYTRYEAPPEDNNTQEAYDQYKEDRRKRREQKFSKKKKKEVSDNSFEDMSEY